MDPEQTPDSTDTLQRLNATTGLFGTNAGRTPPPIMPGQTPAEVRDYGEERLANFSNCAKQSRPAALYGLLVSARQSSHHAQARLQRLGGASEYRRRKANKANHEYEVTIDEKTRAGL